MAETSLRLLDPPHFIVCDDVRSEISGKRFLIGVYPGNVVVLASFPADVVTTIWSVLRPSAKGVLNGQFRMIRADDQTIAFEDKVHFNIQDMAAVVPVPLRSKCTMEKPGRLNAELRVFEEDWLLLGSFDVGAAAGAGASPTG